MKKTLFLAVALGLSSTALAELTFSNVSGRNTIQGTGVIESNTTLGKGSSTAATGSDATNIGSLKGDADVTLAAGVNLTVPNALLIGGVGNGLVGDAHNGILSMESGSSLTVGNETTSSGGAHVDVGNSKQACTGELYMTNASFSACQLVIGQGLAQGYMEMRDGSEVTLEQGGKKGTQLGLIIGYTGGTNNGTGTLVVNNSTLKDTNANSYAFIGTMGSATVALQDGATMELAAGVYAGDVWEGAYDDGITTAKADISIDKDSTLNCHSYAEFFGNSSVVNEGTFSSDSFVYASAAAIENKGVFHAEDGLEAYSTRIDNSGTIEADSVIVGDTSTLITGNVAVTGCDNAMQVEHVMSAVYDNGLSALTEGEKTMVILDALPGDTITIGARVDSGNGAMQYVYAADLREIDRTIRAGIDLYEAVDWNEYGNVTAVDAYDDAASDIKLDIAHILGKNITANVTTDDACEGADVTVVLDGAHLVVRVGEEEGSVDKVGTLGSYENSEDETAASVRVNTKATGSIVAWEGSSMKTVEGETSTLTSGNTVKVGRAETESQSAVEGTLTVVKDSTLNNNGAVDSDTVVVQGTLNNNGSIEGAAVVEQGGTLKGSGSMGATDVYGNLVVGNSPGAPSFAGDLTLYGDSKTTFSIGGLQTPAAQSPEALNGWESPVYSQITITDGGVLTLEDGAVFEIEFGGCVLDGQTSGVPFEFDLTLVQAGESAITLSSSELDGLLNRTIFSISDDPAAGTAGWYLTLDRSLMSYTVEDNGSTLHLKGTMTITIPEPATATLSLLALAAMAARRRRK